MTYDGDLSTELILDVAFLECIWTFIFDDGEELLDTHGDDLSCLEVWLLGYEILMPVSLSRCGGLTRRRDVALSRASRSRSFCVILLMP
jgi:hypothetical protein